MGGAAGESRSARVVRRLGDEVFRILRAWFRENREWHQNHIQAWTGYTVPESDSFTRFQRECEAALASHLSSSGFHLADRTVTTERFDRTRSEQVIFAQVAASDVEMWIISDGAQIGGAGIDCRFEEWGSLTPQELTDEFSATVLKLARERSKLT